MSGAKESEDRWFTCPVCEVRFCASQSQALPFCSPRCRLVDLGRWLDEQYGLPLPERSPEEDLEDR